jgi:hypothetical protein
MPNKGSACPPWNFTTANNPAANKAPAKTEVPVLIQLGLCWEVDECIGS